ncbi:MAG: anthranilate phosphoribosyltransferase [Desulfobacterales bacterium]|jgi:anthranilate phosphoribosyltransferase|nr:anthranilate phosphoribosyltransferase [Desulfobacterales bacterium]MDP6682512.1 anthranilate phosphoribosyltransferase [Desulfobacterales bacterium]MDP6808747.1 anthranilate phosphoribosyltransferase [Desulfobacterales bacterium]|tara:strand:- start:3771 stop:4850 length:1080 start_codon:yes stop_codon:yes gene_type:complete
MIKEFISKVVRGDDLTEIEMEKAMDEIMSGTATPAQIGSFITALRLKGESVDEIAGAARAMRAKATKICGNNHIVNIDRDEINIEDETILDIVGTGGDGTRTFNVSTTTAFVAAGGGIKVAKHGNRAVSSICGSADVIENLGVDLDLTSTDVERCIKEVGIGFLYAPIFHGAMKYAAGPRREIGIRSIFNLLGPVTNPAGASVQVLGVYEPSLTDKMAHVLKRLGTKEAFVVCGEGTFDEISICGPTRVSHLKDDSIHTFQMTPEVHGFKRAALEEIVGGDAKENARIIRNILDGEKGPKREMVLLNASAAFMTTGLCDNFRDGIEIAMDSIDSGKACKKLDKMIEFTRQCKPFIRNEL